MLLTLKILMLILITIAEFEQTNAGCVTDSKQG